MRSLPAPLIAILRLIVLAALIGEPLRWAWDSLMASEIRLSLHDAGARRSLEGGLGQEIKVVGGEGRVAIFAHPPSRLEWPLRLRRGQHHFRSEIALAEDAWEKSDGLTFTVKLVQQGREILVASHSLDPRQESLAAGWIPLEASFDSDGGPLVLVLETAEGSEGRSEFDWGWWAEPRVEETYRGLAIGVLALLGLLLWLLSRELGVAVFPKRVFGTIVFLALTLVVVEILFRSAPAAFPPDAHGHLARNGFCEVGDRHPLRVADPELGYREPSDRCDTYRVLADAVLEEDMSPAFEESLRSTVQVCLDRDGFRNPVELERVEIVAVGDSFVQGAWVAQDEIWTTLVGEQTGRSVLNLGVSGYSPRQSMINLSRHGLPRGPDLILFALFAGNDLTDEEQFDAYERSGMTWSRFSLALEEVRDVSTLVRGYQHSFALAGLSYLADLGMTAAGRASAAFEEEIGTGFNPLCASLAGAARSCFAFTARELLRETLTEEQWRSRSGTELLRRSLVDLRDTSLNAGAESRIVLIPSKASIYLPYLLGDVQENALEAFLEEVASEPPPEATWLEALEAHSGAVHRVMIELLQEKGIAYVDLLPAFTDAAARGEVLYFPYDSHWNAEGNRLAARVVAASLQE